jgi:hypothetical protein
VGIAQGGEHCDFTARDKEIVRGTGLTQHEK